MIIQQLEKLKLAHPPDWLGVNTHYLTLMGSFAYAVSHDESDLDIYGFAIPHKDVVFPHLAGKLYGFDKDINTFDQWQEHHIEYNKKVYDFSVYNIIKYFSLLMDNNPNILDSIFTPANCVLHCSAIGEMVRSNRKIFLHKGCWHKFKGYAFSQLHKMSSKTPEEGSKRSNLREQFGFDVKFGYHVVRLIGEVQQILAFGDLDIQQDNERLKSIRRGEWTEQQIRDYFTAKEPYLEKLYQDSKLPWGPDIPKIKALLFECLEHHFGNLDKCVTQVGREADLLRQIKDLLTQNGV